MSETKHTPEPWRITGGNILTGAGAFVPISHQLSVHRDFHREGVVAANQERIVACVNALAGVDDPAAELTRLRELKAACEAWREADRSFSFLSDLRDSMDPPTPEVSRDAAHADVSLREAEQRIADLIDAMKEQA